MGQPCRATAAAGEGHRSSPGMLMLSGSKVCQAHFTQGCFTANQGAGEVSCLGMWRGDGCCSCWAGLPLTGRTAGSPARAELAEAPGPGRGSRCRQPGRGAAAVRTGSTARSSPRWGL